eukprot:2345322-Rhodomonas_salina.2
MQGALLPGLQGARVRVQEAPEVPPPKPRSSDMKDRGGAGKVQPAWEMKEERLQLEHPPRGNEPSLNLTHP